MSWSSAVRKKAMPVKIVVPRPTILTADIDWERLVTVDFETFWGAGYTLSSMSTSEYVRDPRFKAQMVGIKIGSKPTKVYSPKQLKKALTSINWGTHSLLCHNTAFDGFIMSHHYGITPAKYYCTLSMARGLHSNEIGASLDDVAGYYGKGSKIEGALESTKDVLDWSPALYDATALYCAQDVELTHAIFKEMHAAMPAEEMELINMTLRMFCAPVLRVDVPRVQAEYDREVAERKERLLSVIDPRKYDDKTTLKKMVERALTGEDRDMLIVKRVIGSNDKFVALLRDAGLTDVQIPTKVSPAYIKKSPAEKMLVEDGDKYSYAFAKDDLEFTGLPDRVWDLYADLNPEDPGDIPRAMARQIRLQALIDARLSVKSTTNITRAERFLEAGKGGMKLPVGYSYYRAHTGRWGGNNKMNMQNLTRGGELRLSILAAPGHQMCVADSGQIEARVNAWLWGQTNLLDSFARGNDIYSEFASEIYHRLVTKSDKNERHVGKASVLGLGYQMGPDKFQMTLAKGALGGPKINFSRSECAQIVMTYRRTYAQIAGGWKHCTQIIEEMAAGISGSHKCLHWGNDDGIGFIDLPNGMRLKYPDLRKARGEKDWDEWSYQSGDVRKKIYGGLLCLGAETEVLTDSGWKSIIFVREKDKLWDGTDWVVHSGLAYQGTKETIDFGGVDMTPDHEVLVNGEWFAAKETTHHEATSSFERHHWTPDWHAGGGRTHWERRAQNPMESAVPVRQHANLFGHGVHQGWHKKLRVLDTGTDLGREGDSRHVETPGLRGVALNDGSVPSTFTPVLDKLRRSWRQGLRTLAGVSEFLGRHAEHLCAWVGIRPTRQLEGVLAGQLPLGDKPSEQPQSSVERIGPNTKRPDAFMAGGGGVGHREDDFALPAATQLACGADVRQTGRKEQAVYDLLNAGPNRRFTVRGKDGKPFVVHNCENLVQALARIIVAWQMLQIDAKYPVVMTTHDECVTHPKTREAQKCYDFMEKWMTTAPWWCHDIPLAAEGGFASNYSK